MRVRVKKLREDAVLPSYAHVGDAGLDLCALDSCVVGAGERKLIPTGISMELPEGYFASIRGKSGLAYKKGVCILGGVVEYTYRGDYGVIFLNTSSEDIEIEAGQKIAQVVVAPVATVEIEDVEELGKSVRGADGFGSTGK
jgi:dUTP pyrophosphatase